MLREQLYIYNRVYNELKFYFYILFNEKLKVIRAKVCSLHIHRRIVIKKKKKK